MKPSSTRLSKIALLCIVFFMHDIFGQVTGKIVPWTYNTSYNPGFNTSAYEAWAYQRKSGWKTQTLPFRLLKPIGYSAGAPKYPLIIMLHGRGERGTDNNYQLLWGGQKHQQAVQTGKFPGFVVFPQEPFGAWTNTEKYQADGTQPSTALSQVLELVDSLLIKYNIDPDRVYVHGLSSGGTGTWACLYNRPDLFAAALPMSTPGDESQVNKISPTPIWLFQGETDTNPIASISRSMMNALRNAGAINPALTKYTEYPGVAHFVWNLAYDDPDFFPFMLRQNKKNVMLMGPNPIPNGGTTALGIGAGFAAYQWYRDGSPLAGATTHRLSGITLPGTYYVRFMRKTTSTTWETSTSVVINGSTANQLPIVTLVKPTEGSSYSSPQPFGILVEANASDPDGTISKVELLVNDEVVGERTTAPYEFVYTVTSTGNYKIQVRATDNQAAISYSAAVNVTGTIENEAPTVSITSPANGSNFNVGDNVTITASANDVDGTITKVEFYNGNVLLGVASTAPYTYTIANAAAGSYSLRAVATDNIGSAVGSETITIHVNSTETLGTGLTGTYFNNMYLSPPQVLKRNDPTVNFEWGTGSPLNGVVSINNFSVRWTGKVLAPVTGTYTFSVQGDDGVRLTVGGSVLINNFTYKNTIDQGTISLVGGQKYDINLEYFEGGGSATVILKWAYPGQALTVVPQIKLYPSESVPSARIDLDNDKQSDYELTLYPNPTSQYLNIHVPALTALVQVSVMKIDGSEAVLEQEFHNALGEMTLPVDHLENGVYLVSISHDGYTLKEKLVVRKGN